ncbi:uncharacterized protein LOC144137648 [Haemaphysalis longicornis]
MLVGTLTVLIILVSNVAKTTFVGNPSAKCILYQYYGMTINERVSVHYPVKNCRCRVRSQQGVFPDGTLCSKLDLGYDGEMTRKKGTCKNGTCELTPIPLGCIGHTPPSTVKQKGPQIGCTFTCINYSKRRVEFGYLNVSTPCQVSKKVLENTKAHRKLNT